VHALHPHGPLDRELVPFLVVPQVRDHVGGVGIFLARLRRHEPSWQGREGGRGEQTERVPGVLPGAARRGLGIQDDEVHAEAAQVVAGGEPGLAAADDHHLRVPAARHEIRTVRADCGQHAAWAR